MKVLSSIKLFLLRVWHSMFFKYAVVCIAGVLIVLIWGTPVAKLTGYSP